LAKVHAYLITHLRDEMPSMFGKTKKQQELVDGKLFTQQKLIFYAGLRDVFIKVHQKYSLPVGDFPDINRFKETLKAQDFSKFQKLNQKMIDAMDTVLAEDIPRLMQQFPSERDAAQTVSNINNPFEAISVFDPMFDEGPIPRYFQCILGY
jgi:hypothetical protein